MELPLDQILLGDCLDLLKGLPDESIDSCVTDCPYGLGNKDPSPEDILAYLGGATSMGPLKKGRRHCLNSITRDASIVDAEGGDASVTEDAVTFRVSLPLMTRRVIEFDRKSLIGEHEVDDEGPIPEIDDILVDEVEALLREGCGDCVLRLRERKAYSGCVKACGCFTPSDETTFRVLVWLTHDSFGESQSTASIVTVGATEVRAVLALDLAKGTGEILPASGADEGDAGLLLATSENVGASDGASRLLTAIQVLLTHQIALGTDGALTFDLSVPGALLRRLHESRVPLKDFMDRGWEIPSVAVWREVYRVLKPGGHVLSFGGTRTFDLISIGMRMAGFECRDTIGRNYPILQWITGQGMPKSHNVSTAIDKKLGKKREVIGVRSNHRGRPLTANWDRSLTYEGAGYNGLGTLVEKVTVPASDEAKQWSGWGSGLKPAFEPILVFRKPLAGTLASNVLKHGTGGLNIDATRVRHASKEDFDAHKKGVDAIRDKGGSRDKSWKNASDLSGANEVKASGRWPSNVLLEHSASCRKVGTKEIASHPQGPDRFQKTTGGDFSDAYGNQLAADEPEVLPVWSCVEGCPVLALDAQSGDRPSTLTGRADPNGSHEHPGTEMNPTSTFLGERTHLSKVYADAGGASRFFTQIEGDEAYSSKGRFPSNLILEHAEGCVSKGTQRVRRRSGDIKGTEPSESTQGVYGKYSQRAPNNVGVDGFETIEAWTCVDGCPVKALDDQSGIRRSAYTGQGDPSAVHVVTDYRPDTKGFSSGGKITHDHVNYQDEGGASRFFTQVEGEKADADEGGVDRFFSQFEAEGEVPFRYIPKANRKEAGCGEFEVQHVTVKPLKLLCWLVRLVTPPGGIVLDPYCGSGTTCHAATLEGFHFIGMERDAVNHAEATRRLEIVFRQSQEKKDDEAIFDFAMGRDV